MFEGNLKKEIFERSSLSETVLRYVELFSKMWQMSSSSTPQPGVSYSFFQKLKHEKEIKIFIKTVEKEIKKDFGDEINTKNSLILNSTIKRLLKSAFDFKNEQINILFRNNFLEITKQFIIKAKTFDPSIIPIDIFQASRNVWTMNWLQLIFGLPIELTPSVFAYSMLYPYTDNYIDNPCIPLNDKIIFNERLTSRLAGETLSPINSNEGKIFKLIEMIESEYDRLLFPEVYDSLLAIHSAQIKSLSLLYSEHQLSIKDLLIISIEKGGTSVLADGYLVAGNLTETQKLFTFGYGAFLQLVDDLQDIKQDFDGGLNTIFTEAARNYPLDSYANKTYNWGNEIISMCDYVVRDNLESTKTLMKKSDIMMMTGTIGLASGFYTKPFLKKIETFSPFRFSFLKKHQKNYKYYNSLFIQITGKITLMNS